MTTLRHQLRRRSATGFTLVEMLVVLAIVVILLALSVTAILAAMKADALEYAFNQVSAKLAAARALAMRDGKDVALVFMTSEDDDEVVEMYLMKCDTSSAPIKMTRIDDRPAEKLRRRIRVRGPDFADVAGSTGDDHWLQPCQAGDWPNGNWLAVWFSPDGTTVTCTPQGWWNMWYDEDGSKWPPDTDEYDDRNTNGTLDLGEGVIPIPYLVLFDQSDLDADAPADEDAWINTAGNDAVRVLAFNRYTGVLMSRSEN